MSKSKAYPNSISRYHKLSIVICECLPFGLRDRGKHSNISADRKSLNQYIYTYTCFQDELVSISVFSLRTSEIPITSNTVYKSSFSSLSLLQRWWWDILHLCLVLLPFRFNYPFSILVSKLCNFLNSYTLSLGISPIYSTHFFFDLPHLFSPQVDFKYLFRFPLIIHTNYATIPF